jgi:hypothetical protein
MSMTEHEFMLHSLAAASRALQTMIDTMRAAPGPVDVEPLVLLNRRVLLLFGRIFKRQLSEAEIVEQTTALVRELADGLAIAVDDLKKLSRK